VRISDWSSDVCSSDLTGSTPKIILTALLVALAGCEQPDDTQNQASAVPGNLSANAMGNAMSPPVQTSSENISGNDSAQQKEPVLPPSTADLRFVGSWAAELGKAQCRERVGQYV